MGQLCQLISPLKDDLLFARMRVSEGLSRLFEIALVAHSLRNDLDGSMLLGQSITIRVSFDDDTERFFNGFVTRMSQGAQEGRYYSYHLTLNPWLWFLTRTSDCRIFQDKKVPDILKAVFDLEPNAAVDEKGSTLGSGSSSTSSSERLRTTPITVSQGASAASPSLNRRCSGS